MRVSAAIPVLATAGLASAQSCPAIGEKNAEGLVSCDPEIKLPNGELCVLEGECYFVEGTGLIIPSSTISAAPSSTSCPAAGETNAEGDYSCNPAHQYPDGQLCVLKAGCYFLEGTGLIVSTTLSSAAPSGTPCPAPGEINAEGDYSCNPAHQYPDGQVCVLKAGCYFLEGTGGKIPTTTSCASPTGTACPAAGETNAEGDYSCNPAHQYPEGQLCVLKDGCYYLEGTGAKIPSCTSCASPTSTACPAAGQTNAEGDYSCNPAHEYPEGQLCVLKDGCYFLEGTGLNTATHGADVPQPTDFVIAGASRQTALSGLAAAIALVAAVL